MVKNVDAVKLRVVVAAVDAVDAVLVAQHLLKLGAHLVTALARIYVQISHEEAAWRLGASGRKGRGEPEKRKKLRVEVWHGSVYPEREN